MSQEIKSYAGIGSRATPIAICHLMRQLARRLAQDGWVLRSGNAPRREQDRSREDIGSADEWFQFGANPQSWEIYLPCARFNGMAHGQPGTFSGPELPAWPQALALVEKYHPNPRKLTDFAMALMARNAFQVLGKDLQSPAKMIVCYTRDGHLVGGTAQAIRIAQDWGIPVRNLGKPDTLATVKDWLANKNP